ncbi:peptide/nickel transport system substrate-binding protein [Murinocardiopsis flavida]|uniref:Peptide/nickel transport system substrate-binding protein n=1 Tax=Murinocardiopsis flavida TaxID=645275 RepID=A0A2P8DLI8_9ACTN|nr:peptide/nickel transport system substrate-binding protein [Murinocardiopsis flavida]
MERLNILSRRALGFVAVGAVATLLLSACGGGGDGGGGGDAKFNQGVESIVNKSDKKGGSLRYAIASNMESTDPGNTYYGYVWNFSRYYARTLYTYDVGPKEAGHKVVPDLADGEPEISDDGKTYTIKIKPGMKYEDGSEIVAEDFAYAVARSNFGEQALPNGPKYYADYLAKSEDYKGPYDNPDDPLKGFGGVEVKDETTLVFHLNRPFADFPFVLVQPQSAPVPADKDKGEQYQTKVLSSGPYKFDGEWNPGSGLKLVRNDEWDAESDPVRKALPDKVSVEEGVDQNEIDQRLQNGDLDVDLGGRGLGPAAKGTALTDDAVKANLDNPESGAHNYMAVNTKVKPFDKIECREAIQWANDRTSTQRAWGGDVGGTISSQLLPPSVPGADAKINPFKTKGDKGNVEKAKQALADCGEEGGLDVNLGVRSDRPEEVAAAEAIQQSLKKADINVNIRKFPSDTFTNTQAGSPSFVKKNKLALSIYGWMPDWNTGFGYMSQIMHGDAIKKAGNSNLAELDAPEVNKLLDESQETQDEGERNKMYTEADQKIMESATVAPLVFQKSVLYRPETLTNVYFSETWKMYDYMALGTTAGGE